MNKHHSHDSHHSHHSHHSHEGHTHGSLSDKEKLVKMIEHWVHHNQDHAKAYREWAQRAKEQGHDEVCQILQSIADGTVQQNDSMEKALSLLRS